jgi:meso-butanediol dehydrogenase/(S,S)-butanediol dehydrogenase/diacetyl reductase
MLWYGERPKNTEEYRAVTEKRNTSQRMEGRVALVTGAASGIGRATAERLASEGASVLCVDLMADELENTVETCHKFGGSAQARVCDVADAAQIEATVSHCIDQFGKLDSLCNIAGILRMDHTHELALEDWNRVLQINLTGTFLFCKTALPHLLETQGSITNTASTAAVAGIPYGAAYGASKGGVMALTRAIAVEYGKSGVRANCVCPGSVQTGMTSRSVFPEGLDMKLIARMMPLNTPRGPEVVASVIAMLASDDGIHINGEEIRIDDGTLA